MWMLDVDVGGEVAFSGCFSFLGDMKINNNHGMFTGYFSTYHLFWYLQKHDQFDVSQFCHTLLFFLLTKIYVALSF